MEALLISPKRLKELTGLSGNIDDDKLTPFIKTGQDLHVENLLGTRLFDKLKADVLAGTLAGNYLVLVQSYIQPVLAHLAAADFYQFHAYQISNGGIFKHESENGVSIDKSEVDQLTQRQRDLAAGYMRKLDNHLCYYGSQNYPEYLQSSGDEQSPDPARWNRSGLFLD